MTDSTSPAPLPPPTTAGDPPGWQHSELLGRRSLIGAIALLAATALFLVVPPFIDGQTEYATAGVDGRFAVDGFASVQIADGWGIESQNELFTIIAKGGGSAVLTPTAESDVDAREYTQTIVDGLTDSGVWTVDPIQDFTTDAGVIGATYIAHGTDGVSASWVIVDSGRLFVFNGTASEAEFKTGIDDLEQMAKSVVITSTSGAGE